MTSTPDTPSAPNTAEAAPRKAVLTWLACAACVLIFFGIHSSANGNPYAPSVLRAWGLVPRDQIWSGKVWGLLTSAFVHVEIWHLVFNVYWLNKFGREVELLLGRAWFAGLFVAGAWISSAAELAFADTTGIGMSGVVYALFGFIWLASRRVPSLRSVLNRNTAVLLVAWLVGCWIATLAKVWTVGNAAHFFGLAVGAVLGAAYALPERRGAALAAFAALFVAASASVAYAPWSAGWTATKAFLASSRGDYAAAASWYRASLERGQDPRWVWSSLAWLYSASGDVERRDSALKELSRIDPAAAAELQGKFASSTGR